MKLFVYFNIILKISLFFIRLCKNLNLSSFGEIPLIVVDGIETVDDIIQRMKAGASLVQSKFQYYSFCFLKIEKFSMD